MNPETNELTLEENEWCETLCICGHMRVWHLDEEEIEDPQWHIPKGMIELDDDETWCIECDSSECTETGEYIGKPEHPFKQDNLRWLEKLSER